MSNAERDIDLSELTVLDLREILKELGASSAGIKSELIVRILKLDPHLERTFNFLVRRDGERGGAGAGDQGQDESGASVGSERVNTDDSALLRREMEICQREKDLLKCELELARREIELMRMARNVENNEGERGITSPSISRASVGRPSLNMVADSLSYFDGSSDSYEF